VSGPSRRCRYEQPSISEDFAKVIDPFVMLRDRPSRRRPLRSRLHFRRVTASDGECTSFRRPRSSFCLVGRRTFEDIASGASTSM